MFLEQNGWRTKYRCDHCGKIIDTQTGHYKHRVKLGKPDICSNCSSTMKILAYRLDPLKKEIWIESIRKSAHHEPQRKVACPKCGREVGYSQITNHSNRCDGITATKRQRAKFYGKGIWNKGQTKETNETLRKAGEKIKVSLRKSFESGRWQPRPPEVKGWSWGHDGWHTTWDGKRFYYRSNYELDYMTQLDEQKVPYEVESLRIKYWNTKEQRFRHAIPDIFIPSTNTIIEIKSKNTLDQQEMEDKKKAYFSLGYSFKLILDRREICI
jgi:hypothetical protein